MKTYSWLAWLLLGVVVQGALAGEPPEAATLKQKVQMASLIVTGEIAKISIVDAASLKFLRSQGDLARNEKAWAEIKIDRVLYSSKSEILYARTNFPKNVSVVFGRHRMTVDPQSLPWRGIFFLTGDPDRPYRYPFFDWTNLYVPLDKEAEVQRLIAAFEAIK